RELAEQYFADERAVFASGQPLLNREERAVDPAGGDKWLLTTKVPLRDGGGTVVGLVGISHDITQRKRAVEELRASRERFELAVPGSRDGLWDWDLRTDVSYYSPRWKGMLGYEDHEIPNRYEEFERRLHPDDRDRVLTTIRDYLESKIPDYEIEIR